MASQTGNNGVIKVGANQIAQLTGWSISENAPPLENTVLGSANRTYLAGLAEVTGTINCFYDKSDTAQNAMTVGAIVTLEFRPEGNGSGKAAWTVSATLVRLDNSVAFQQVITEQYQWQAAGTLAKGTQP